MVDGARYEKYKHLWTTPNNGKPFDRWSDLTKYFREHREAEGASSWQGWIFRGDKQDKGESNKRLLESTLERTTRRRFENFDKILEKFTKPRIDKKKPPTGEELAYIECGMIREFHRKARKYVPHLPERSERMDLIAWLQHFGAPTRLIDWTYSFYVAAYFALNRLNPYKEQAVIWALDRDYLQGKAEERGIGKKQRRWKGSTREWYRANRVLWARPPYTLVCPVNPHELHDRLVAQQGLFLAAGNLGQSFMENLAHIWHEEDMERFIRIEAQFDLPELAGALEDLEDMNINQATLFPGINGFVEQLENQIIMRDKLYVADFEKDCFVKGGGAKSK